MAAKGSKTIDFKAFTLPEANAREHHFLQYCNAQKLHALMHVTAPAVVNYRGLYII